MRVFEGLINIESILDHIEDSIFAIDPSGLIRYANPAFCRLLGYQEDEILGLDIQELVADENIFSTCMVSVKRYGYCHNQETLLRHKSGSLIHVVKNVRSVEDKNGTVSSILVSMRDLSEVDR
ncbi:MAG: PAS domain-containing protein, partial [Spirochaetia bacterium]|nr:PAS domain-containing protein [Spirochaetia bacterium]